MTLPTLIRQVRPEILSSLHRRQVTLGDLGPVISITFDDFPLSAFTCGARLLERFGWRATYYATMGLMGRINALGKHFELSDLRSLAAGGHEVASHTFSHHSARKVPVSTFISDAEMGEQQISRQLGRAQSLNFAYPFGDVTLTVKRRMGDRMRSCRGTFRGLNGPQVDLGLLRANPLYGDMESSAAARRLIIQNEERKRWLIFYSHDVTDNPSPFGCTPALLEDILSFAASRCMKVLTVAEVLDALCGVA